MTGDSGRLHFGKGGGSADGGGGGGDAGGGGGGGDIQLRQAEARRQALQALKGGDYSNEDLLYNWLSASPGTQYREESFRDPQWVNWQQARPTQGMADAEDYKRMIMEAGDPRGIFSGDITNSQYQTPGAISSSQGYLDHFNRMTSVLGMDPSTMSTNVQSNLSGNIAPWSTDEQRAELENLNTTQTTDTGIQTGPYDVAQTAYPTDQNTTAGANFTNQGVLGGGGWQPFMTDDEAGQYYGQYAHGGPVALRRKMFSMGGDVDRSHGVGLTSGLTKTVPPKRGPMPQGFRTGGHVVPQRVGYQPANHPHRQGNREGHMGILKTIGKGILESINPNIWKKVPGGAVDEAAEAAGKGADDWAKSAEAFGGTGSKIPKEVFESLPPSLKRKLLRAGMVGGTYGGITSALFPKTDIKNAESDAEKALGIGREGLEWLSTISPVGQVGNIASNIYQAFKPSGEADYTLTPAGAIRNAMGTTGAEIVASAEEDVGGDEVIDLAEEISQEDMIKAEYQKKLDLYKDLLGQGNEGENNWSTLSDALVRSGTALTSGKGWGDALGAFHEPLSSELAMRRQRHENINQAAATQAMTEMFTGDQTDKAADLAAWAGGDYGFTNVRVKMQEAQEEGITAMVPVDKSNEFDEDSTRDAGPAIFLNPDGKGGTGFYVAVNKAGGLKFTDDLAEAKQWADS